jgi:hypothetical protein
MQHNGEEFFILTDAKESIAYEGTEEDAKKQFDEAMKGHEGVISFYVWCAANLTQVSELDPEDYNNDYLVLTDEEADAKAKEYILDSAWAFMPSFLADVTGINYQVFKAIQNNGKCESNNDAILSTIDDKQYFVDQAISADGRGHFMSSYDGNEDEETVNGETFYIYRLN